MTLHWEVPDAATLRRILSSFPGRAQSTHFRDVYFDTGTGELRQRGGRCRLRFTAGGDRLLTVWQPDGSRSDAPVREADDVAALTGPLEPARRLRALIDPGRLAPWIERHVERTWRTVRIPVVALPLCDVVNDTISLRRGATTARLCELSARARGWPGGHAAAGRLARRL